MESRVEFGKVLNQQKIEIILPYSLHIVEKIKHNSENRDKKSRAKTKNIIKVSFGSEWINSSEHNECLR